MLKYLKQPNKFITNLTFGCLRHYFNFTLKQYFVRIIKKRVVFRKKEVKNTKYS